MDSFAVAALYRTCSAGDVFSLVPEHRQSIAGGSFIDPFRYKVELEGSATVVRFIGGCTVMQETVPKQNAPWFQGNRNDAIPRDLGVADLPVPPLEMHHRALPVASRYDMHTPIFGRRLLQSNPYTYDTGSHRDVEIGVVLMPRFLPANPGGFHQRLMTVELRWFPEYSPQYAQKIGAGGKEVQPRVRTDELT